MNEIAKHLKNIRHELESIEELLSGGTPAPRAHHTPANQSQGPEADKIEALGMSFDRAEDYFGLGKMIDMVASETEEKYRGFIVSLGEGLKKYGKLTDAQTEKFKKSWWHAFEKDHKR